MWNGGGVMWSGAGASERRIWSLHALLGVHDRCEWARTVDADTLLIDVSGFKKEELKVLYNTSRKLKVAGERPISDGGGARCCLSNRSVEEQPEHHGEYNLAVMCSPPAF